MQALMLSCVTKEELFRTSLSDWGPCMYSSMEHMFDSWCGESLAPVRREDGEVIWIGRRTAYKESWPWCGYWWFHPEPLVHHVMLANEEVACAR